MSGTINDEFRTLTIDGVTVRFTRKEYRVLKRLWRRGIVSRHQMIKICLSSPRRIRQYILRSKSPCHECPPQNQTAGIAAYHNATRMGDTVTIC